MTKTLMRSTKLGTGSLDGKKLVEIFRCEVFDPVALLDLKPKNSSLTDDEWLLFAPVFGIAHTWNHLYQDWYDMLSTTGGIKPYNGGGLQVFLSHHFGEVGSEIFALSDGSLRSAADIIRTKELTPDKLGIFWEWFRNTGINPESIGEIIYEFLTD